PVSFTSLNGQNTLTENMADFGGLVTAYDIFVEKKIKEGFAGEKLIEQKKMFFQSFALAWAGLETDEDMTANLITDPHSPPLFRVNGNVCQIDEWYELYDVRFGDKYYLDPNQRTVLW
ncbi:MAG: hypothetical protein J6W76_05175, partial [Spirochaetales bacterium]|nr:hypothetical protein [Spirochaetales bacterium]